MRPTSTSSSTTDEKHIYSLASLNPRFTKMEFTDDDNPTKEEIEQAEEEVKEEYLACLTIDGSNNSHFETSKTNLEKKMACGSDSLPKYKKETMGLIKNYNMSKKLTHTNPEMEESAFTQTNRDTNVDTKTNKTNKNGE